MTGSQPSIRAVRRIASALVHPTQDSGPPRASAAPRPVFGCRCGETGSAVPRLTPGTRWARRRASARAMAAGRGLAPRSPAGWRAHAKSHPPAGSKARTPREVWERSPWEKVDLPVVANSRATAAERPCLRRVSDPGMSPPVRHVVACVLSRPRNPLGGSEQRRLHHRVEGMGARAPNLASPAGGRSAESHRRAGCAE